MTQKQLVIVAMLGSALLLIGAWGFQHIGGLEPCNLCIKQRWPHGLAVLIGAVILWTGLYHLAPLGALTAMVGAGYGAYHSGVEKKWWAGPQTCSGGADRSDLSAEEILNQLLTSNVVMCDEIAWSFLNVSMAGWNMLFSLALVWVWLSISNRAEH